MGKLFNFVRVSTPTTGTATTLTIGSASAPFQTPAAAGAVAGDVLPYTIEDGTQREVTFGTVGAGGTTITRAATPIYSSTGALLDLSGAAILSFGPSAADLMNPDLSGAPAAPPSGIVRLGARTRAGIDEPVMARSTGVERRIMPFLMDSNIEYFQGVQNTANLSGFSSRTTGSNINFQGGSGSALSLTNVATRQPGTLYVSTATAGTWAGFYPGSQGLGIALGGSGLGGFEFSVMFTPNDTIADAVMFVGLSSSTAAPTMADPSTLLNQIGVAKLPGSANLQIVYGGSAAQAPIDLGSGFPASGAGTDLYTLTLYNSPFNNTSVNWLVSRKTGTTTVTEAVQEGVLTGTPGTALPANTTSMGFRFYRGNNTTASQAKLMLSRMYLANGMH